MSQLAYNPNTGDFQWLVSKNGFHGAIKVGAIAGTMKDGYTQITCDQRFYRAHRLAWLFMTGSFPATGFEIDHINGIRNDNRWSNLRLVTRSQNNMNSGKSVANKSGAKGVSMDKTINKWLARIQVNKKIIYLGHFESFEEAAKARKEAEAKYFGTFQRNENVSAI